MIGKLTDDQLDALALELKLLHYPHHPHASKEVWRQYVRRMLDLVFEAVHGHTR